MKHGEQSLSMGIRLGFRVHLVEFSFLAKNSRALFSFKIFCKIDTVAISFVFDKYCLIMY